MTLNKPDDVYTFPAIVDGIEKDATCNVWLEGDDPDNVIVEINIADSYFRSESSGCFLALLEIRKSLEEQDIYLFCYGASKNVYQSGMAGDMGSGDMAYRLSMGEQALRKDLVNIFDTGVDIIPSTIAEQVEYYEEWFRSLGQ